MAISTLCTVSTTRSFIAAVLVLFSTYAQAFSNDDPTGAPLSLDRWKDWVLYEQPELDCPIMFDSDNRVCQWVGQLELNASSAGASFKQTVQAFAETRFTLPGSARNWPSNVRVNGDVAPVVAGQAGQAEILLPRGEHQISGQFDWDSAPQSLQLNPQTGLIALRWNGKTILNPERKQNRLSLGQPIKTSNEQQPLDKLDLSIVRLIQDGHPLLVETKLILDVAGFQREVILGKPILDGLVPLFIDSGSLPAQIDNRGGLRVQVRPGRWEITVLARSEAQPDQLRRAAQPKPWPDEEVWAYVASTQHRLSKIEGVQQIDPRQSKLPNDWQRWPAYLVTSDDTFKIEQVQSSVAATKPDQLSLNRSIWLDFDGEGYSVRDKLNGRLQNTWRLELSNPLSLQSAKINRQPQFITTNNKGKSSGVEVRQGNLDLQADLRLDSSDRTLPANGWGVDFQTVEAVLNTPPGWRLLTVVGADNIPGAWLSGWTVYRVFLLLITVLAIGKLWGWQWTIVSLLAFIPLWLDAHILAYVIIPVLITTALVRLLPKDGAIRSWVQFARMFSLLILIVAIVPFMIQQARNSIFPQLERGNTFYVAADESDALKQVRATEVQNNLDSYSSSVGSRSLSTEAAAPPASKQTKLSTAADPTLVAQTGEGLPDWRWTSTPLRWNGPVLRDQQIKLVILSPAQVFFIRFAALSLLALLLWRFLDIGRGQSGKWWLAPIAAVAMTGNAQADFPQDQLLNELAERMRASSVAAPRASINSMQFQLKDRRLDAQLEIHALSDTAVPLPLDNQDLTPVKVTHADGKNALLFTNNDGRIWALVNKGVHTLTIEVRLQNVDQFQLPLALQPHRVTVESEDWTVRGIERNGVPTGQLNFVRTQRNTESTTEIKPSVLPPFFKVDRLLSLGIKWQVSTTVHRQDLSNRAESIRIPLLNSETVITEGIEVENDNVLASFRPGAQTVQWQSLIDPVSPIQLQAVALPNALEVWRLDVGTMWHVEIAGATPIFHQSGGNAWQPNWHPWPGDSIQIDVTRPEGVDGPSLSIEKSTLEWRPSTRVSEGFLTLNINSSRGTQHPITLPNGADLQSVSINGQAQAIAMQGDNITLPIQPGSQRAQIRWRQADPISYRWTTPAPTLGVNHVNATLSVQMPTDRWVLWMDGPRLGPAVVMWGLLIVMLFLATALGEASRGRIPAGALSWLFIGLGLSQFSILALIPIALWLFLIYYRTTVDPRTASKFIFNTMQVGIVIMTFVALIILLQAVQTGLLGFPQMKISGNGSSNHLFHWYQDRASADYPRARIFSVPLYFYRAVMLVWALWLAYTLINWLQWGWSAFSKGGLKSTAPKKAKKKKNVEATS